MNYYRLEQVDLDGSTSFSKVISSTIKSYNTTKQLVSNVIIDHINLQLEDESAEFILSNMNGQVMLRQFVSGTSDIDVSNLLSGMYIAQIIINNEITTEKIIIR